MIKASYFILSISIYSILSAMTDPFQESLKNLEESSFSTHQAFNTHLQTLTHQLCTNSFNQNTITYCSVQLNRLQEMLEKKNYQCCSLCKEGKLCTLKELQDTVQKNQERATSLKGYGLYFLVASGIMGIDKIIKMYRNIPFSYQDLDVIFFAGSSLSCLAGAGGLQKRCNDTQVLIDNYIRFKEQHEDISKNYEVFNQWHTTFKQSNIQWTDADKNYPLGDPLQKFITGQRYDGSVKFSLLPQSQQHLIILFNDK